MPEDSNKQQLYSQKERRKSHRLDIEDFFSLCITLTSTDDTQSCRIKNLSKSGIKFLSDASDQIKVEDIISAKLYLNNTLFLPLQLKIKRINGPEISCEFENQDLAESITIDHFINFLACAASNLKGADKKK